MQTSKTTYGNLNVSQNEGGISIIPSATITEIGRSDILLSFIINVILLLGGLWMTQQLGVAGGKLASMASNKIQSVGAKIAKSPWSATKLMAKSANQSIVKATGGRVSFDPRDYTKAFQTTREERRKEAYQDFFGRKQKLFKQWGTPTGVLRGVFGAPQRLWKKNKTLKEKDKKKKEYEDILNHGNLGETYKGELEKEEIVLNDKKNAIETQLKTATGPNKAELEQEKEDVDKKLKENKDLQAKPIDQLAADYREKLNDNIRRIEADEKKHEDAMASGAVADIIDVRIKEIDDDIELVDQELAHNDLYGKTLTELRDDKIDDAGTLKVGDLKIKSDDTKADLTGGRRSDGTVVAGVNHELALARANAKKSGDYTEVNKLEKKQRNLQLQYGLLDKVKVPYAETKKNIIDSKNEIKRISSEKKLVSNEIQDAKKSGDKDKEATLNKQLNQLNADEADQKEELAKNTDKIREIKGDPASINSAIAVLEQSKGDLSKEKIIKTHDKEALEKTKPEDKDAVAKAIAEGWDKLIKQNKNNKDKMQADIKMPDISRQDKENYTGKLKDLQKEIDKIQTAWYQTSEPADYFVEQERRRNVSEERRKVTTENSEELISEFKKAVAGKNNARAKALVMKLTEDMNLNELMNAYGEKSNFEGLNNFREKILQGELGLDEQEALQFQNDVSYSAENIGHWASARTVGYNVTQGKYYAMGEDEHTKVALAEIMKMQPRNIVSSLNRLAYGGERQNADGSRLFEIDKLGEAIVIAAQNVISKEIGHMQVNVATNLSSPASMLALNELVKQGKIEANILRQIQSRTAQGAEKTPTELVDYLMKGIRK